MDALVRNLHCVEMNHSSSSCFVVLTLFSKSIGVNCNYEKCLVGGGECLLSYVINFAVICKMPFLLLFFRDVYIDWYNR